MGVEAEEWELAFGVRRRGRDSGVWVPVVCVDGTRLADRLSPSERFALVRTSATAPVSAGGHIHFRAEFVFSPDTSERLVPAPTSAGAPRIPPCGTQPARPSSTQSLGGHVLRQTAFEIKATKRRHCGSQQRRSAIDEPGRNIPAPPPGQYESAVGRFGTDVAVLLAIEPEMGTPFIWLPIGKRCEPLNHCGGGSQAETSIQAEQWRVRLLQGKGPLALALRVPSRPLLPGMQKQQSRE